MPSSRSSPGWASALGALLAASRSCIYLFDGTWLPVRAVVEDSEHGRLRPLVRRGRRRQRGAPLPRAGARARAARTWPTSSTVAGWRGRMRLTQRSPAVRAVALLAAGLIGLGVRRADRCRGCCCSPAAEPAIAHAGRAELRRSGERQHARRRRARVRARPTAPRRRARAARSPRGGSCPRGRARSARTRSRGRRGAARRSMSALAAASSTSAHDREPHRAGARSAASRLGVRGGARRARGRRGRSGSRRARCRPHRGRDDAAPPARDGDDASDADDDDGDDDGSWRGS